MVAAAIAAAIAVMFAAVLVSSHFVVPLFLFL
jgi:hypothetical protein